MDFSEKVNRKKWNVIKLISIDQSSVKTGYAIYEDNKLIKYDIIDLTKEKDLELRFRNMCSEIHKLIQDNSPDYVVLEDVALQTNPSTLTTLARLQGAIIQSLLIYKIPYSIYKPSSWRKVLCFSQGRGIARKELKKQAIKYVKDKFDIDAKEDICEAICIGQARLKQNKLKKEESI